MPRGHDKMRPDTARLRGKRNATPVADVLSRADAAGALEEAERKARHRSAALTAHAVDLALAAIRSATAELEMVDVAGQPTMLRAIAQLCREAAATCDTASVARAKANEVVR